MVTGLTNGTAYEFQVAATNSVGTGKYSSTSPALTPVGKPSSPLSVVAHDLYLENGRFRVDFSAPASNGGLPVTSYTVTLSLASPSTAPSYHYYEKRRLAQDTLATTFTSVPSHELY